jgi:DHA2 family multidrug resistance protein
MTGFYLQMDTSVVVWSGLAQGLGSGMVTVPLTAATFATLAPAYRNEATSVFSLLRNVGSAVGIAGVTTMLTRNTQVMHSRLAENITPYLDPLHPATADATAQSVAVLNQTVTNQAAMIAYNNDFKMMMILSLCAIPLVALLRSAQPKPGAEPVVVVE